MTDWGEVFEPAIADIYRVTAAEADVIVDVGANLGSFSSLAAWTHRNGRVYAFEPQKEHAELLRRNLERNRLQNVRILESPVTADGRDVTFFEQTHEGAANIFQSGDGKSRALKSVTLDCVDFAGGRSAFIKLDCEGAEGELIQWLVEHLDQLPPRINIACEYHPWCPVPLEESVGRLTKAGFIVKNEVHFDEPYLFAQRSA
jgi:FkbM family methyltransferase